MRKINLLYVITKLELGGAQKQLLSLISKLDRRRFNIFVFTAQEGLVLGEILSMGGVTLRRSKWLERPINPVKDIAAFFEIIWFIRKNNIEIVHTHSSKAGILGRLAARFAKAKFICHTVHGWSFNDFQAPFVRRIFIALERLSARFSDKLIVVSCHDKQKGLINHIGEEAQYRLIRYGIDCLESGSIGQDNIRQELGIDTADLVVGMVSCLKPQKAPWDFIRLAFLVNKKLPGVRFILAGDGVLYRRTRALINNFNLQERVILTGWRRDINRLLSAMDIFVLTSLWEGLPIAVLEAIVSGVAVVATNTGGIREVVIDGKTGFLVPPGDMQGMSERLVFLLNDVGLRRQMARNAKNNLDGNFTPMAMVKQNQDLYEEIRKPPYIYGGSLLANSK